MARCAPVGWNRAPPCQKEGNTATRTREIAARSRPKSLDAPRRRHMGDYESDNNNIPLLGDEERGHRNPAAGRLGPMIGLADHFQRDHRQLASSDAPGLR